MKGRMKLRTIDGEFRWSLDECNGVLGVTHVDTCVRQTNSLYLQTSIVLNVNPDIIRSETNIHTIQTDPVHSGFHNVCRDEVKV